MKGILFWLFALALCTSDAAAQTQSYYQGKTLRIVVGYPPGSIHDMWARLLAPQFTKNLLGNPEVIIQNMPGAGSMTATNYVYAVAKPDGLTLSINNAALYLNQLLQKKEARFDWSKFTWIGSTTRTSPMLYMWADTPYKTIHDVRAAAVPPKCGTTGTGNTGYYFPKLLEETIGAKFQLVTGYQGGAEIELAVERGEVQCRAFSAQVYFGREPFGTWRARKVVRVLVQGGKKRDPRLPDTPLFNELMEQYKTPPGPRRLADVLLASGELGIAPLFGPPGIAAERIKSLRAAYVKALNNPDVIAEAKKQNLEPELIPGEEVETLAREVVTQPPEVIAAMKRIIGG